MAESIPFDRSTPAAGPVVGLAPGVRRVVAPNPGPFTFTGTCTYLIGEDELAVIDPGPDDDAHRAAILAAAGGRPISHILVTHTHRDHSPGARPLAAVTGAPVCGAGPHRFARPPRAGEEGGIDASADRDYAPDIQMRDGDRLGPRGFELTAIETPGHCANHVCFRLDGKGLFSGDHVMAWSTSIVAPPDGQIGDYMRALEKVGELDVPVFWPGHGEPVREPRRFVRALLQHRRMREAAVMASLEAAPAAIEAIVQRVYAGLDPRLVGAAALNTLAQMEDLVARGLVRTDGEPTLEAIYRLA